MLLGVSLWMLAQIGFWVAKRFRPNPRELVVVIALWSLSLAMCIIVQVGWWASVHPMQWLNNLFEGPTMWMLRGV